MPVYLDYNATTPYADEVRSAITDAMDNYWGNPSSTHTIGHKAKEVVEESRVKVARMIDATSDEIIFTSGGTESNYMVITSAINYFESEKSPWKNHASSSKPHIVTTNIEHDSIRLHLEKLMERNIVDVSFVPVSKETGQISVDDLLKEVRRETCLITVMLANNETGIIQPIREITRVAANLRDAPILFHTDAAQAIGKIDVSVKELNVDFLTLAGHKFYGPRTGALYVKNSRFLSPVFFGGGQEKGFRAGTENVAMIAGLGKAAELVKRNSAVYYADMKNLRDYLEEKLQEVFKDKIVFNNIRRKCSENELGGETEYWVPRLPNTVSVAFQISDVTGSSILKKAHEICASTGAACHSGLVSPSSVLLNSGVDKTLAAKTLRLSVGRETTVSEIDKVIECLQNVLQSQSS